MVARDLFRIKLDAMYELYCPQLVLVRAIRKGAKLPLGLPLFLCVDKGTTCHCVVGSHC